MTPRLKSLELHGYKTFASRTVFEFPGDVTAIVGPNGSGKSNIADALRWVLGEQSYSLLRGRKTEDMIFSGSEQRPRAGMASATITFYNDDGWLPIDFNEVSITRRAYRDGQNEYLLNGQKVRLKEIAELLGKSGLAERTYTIIGQGLVDAALSLKPEERRRFFEEAAGIGLYRGRREEALNRLDSTSRNLERVLDILSELEPRLHSLEKQAKRAQEYERIRADLRLLLRDWYGYHWHRNQQELARAREVLRVQEVRQDQARKRQMEVEESLGSLRANVVEVRNALNEWHTRSAALHTRWEQASRSLAVMDERCRALAQAQQSLQVEDNRLQDEQKMRQEREINLTEERDRLADELKDAQEQAVNARQKLQTRLAERAKVEQAVREARRTLVASETAQVQLKAHQSELTGRIETLRKSKIALANTLSADAEALKQAQDTLEQRLKERQQAEKVHKDAETALQEHRRRVNEQEAQRKQLQDDRSRLEAERARLTARLEVLEQAERSLTGMANGSKFILQEARQGRLKGAYQALSGSLIVPAELESAIAAALGDFLDGLIFDANTDPERALELLSKGDKGRVVLLPASAQATEVLPAIVDPGCLGVAADLVKISGEQTEMLRALLSQAVIVRDRVAARRILSQLPAVARAITLQGEIFYGSGVILAGKETRGGVLARPREMQELRDVLKALEERIAQSKAAWQEMEAGLAQLHKLASDLEAVVKNAAQSVSRMNQAHQQAVLAVEQVRQRHEFQARQLAGMDGQIQRAEQELQQGQAEIEKNGQKMTTFNEQVREQNQKLGKLPVEEFQTQEVHWNTTAAVAGRALKEADRRLTEHYEAGVSTRKQMESIALRLKEAQNTLIQLDREKAHLHEEESVLTLEINELRGQIEPAEKEVAEAEAAYSAQQDIMTAAQQAVAVADRYVTQAHIDFTRVREAIDALRRRVEEDFGLVSFEYHPETSSAAPLPLEGMVEQLPDLAELSPEIEDNINRQRAQLRRMGPINPDVQTEYQSVKERFEFLTAQMADLKKADADLREVITQLDDLMRREFSKTFDAVAIEFKQMFTRLFGGGSARLTLSDADHPTDGGIDIEARLPGRREQGLSLLSGGERSLTAVALIFSLLKVSPTPFCVLDEVDAALDEANVGRFRDLLMELSDKTQFLIVTHNRNTVQAANVIYGVTMGHDSASQVISLKLDEISPEMVE